MSRTLARLTAIGGTATLAVGLSIAVVPTLGVGSTAEARRPMCVKHKPLTHKVGAKACAKRPRLKITYTLVPGPTFPTKMYTAMP